MIKLTYN